MAALRPAPGGHRQRPPGRPHLKKLSLAQEGGESRGQHMSGQHSWGVGAQVTAENLLVPLWDPRQQTSNFLAPAREGRNGAHHLFLALLSPRETQWKRHGFATCFRLLRRPNKTAQAGWLGGQKGLWQFWRLEPKTLVRAGRGYVPGLPRGWWLLAAGIP